MIYFLFRQILKSVRLELHVQEPFFTHLKGINHSIVHPNMMKFDVVNQAIKYAYLNKQCCWVEKLSTDSKQCLIQKRGRGGGFNYIFCLTTDYSIVNQIIWMDRCHFVLLTIVHGTSSLLAKKRRNRFLFHFYSDQFKTDCGTILGIHLNTQSRMMWYFGSLYSPPTKHYIEENKKTACKYHCCCLCTGHSHS